MSDIPVIVDPMYKKAMITKKGLDMKSATLEQIKIRVNQIFEAVQKAGQTINNQDIEEANRLIIALQGFMLGIEIAHEEITGGNING